jgi:UDP-N-acetylglucosamine 2-epimerase (non-hydrolysing)
MKIVTVVGARPQFIKCAALSRELRKVHDEILIHTGQHYDYQMDSIFFEELGIPTPNYHLGVGSGTHGSQTGRMLVEIEKMLLLEKPDLVLVYGDTNSTLAGALAAAKLKTKIAHVEAGLRSCDKSMPEEINRVLTDHCSDLLLCPTQTAVDNLARENITRGVYLTGDVTVDALLRNREVAEKSSVLERLHLESKQYLLVTLHRAANTDTRSRLEGLVATLCDLGERVVFPVHPRTEKQLRAFGLYDRLSSGVEVMSPAGYLDFIKLLTHARKVLTDSGGVQKEAYILKTPCITLRDTTEWPETVADGWNVLVDANPDRIIAEVRRSEPLGGESRAFGAGACGRIVDVLA